MSWRAMLNTRRTLASSCAGTAKIWRKISNSWSVATPSALGILPASATTAMVKLTPGSSRSRKKWPATAPTKAPTGPPTTRPAAAPLTFPHTDMGSIYRAGARLRTPGETPEQKGRGQAQRQHQAGQHPLPAAEDLAAGCANVHLRNCHGQHAEEGADQIIAPGQVGHGQQRIGDAVRHRHQAQDGDGAPA